MRDRNMHRWLMGLGLACALVPATARADQRVQRLENAARYHARVHDCNATHEVLDELAALDAPAAQALREEPLITSCLRPPLAPPPTCEPVYGEIWAGVGRTRFGQAIKNARIAVGYESAPQRCAAPWNVKVGGVFELSNQADDYTLFGGELELDRWVPGLGYAGARAAVVIDTNSGQPTRIASLGVRVHTTMDFSFGLDASWAKVGPTETSRLGGDSAFGLAASIGVRGRLAAVVGTFVTLVVLGYLSGYHDNS